MLEAGGCDAGAGSLWPAFPFPFEGGIPDRVWAGLIGTDVTIGLRTVGGGVLTTGSSLFLLKIFLKNDIIVKPPYGAVAAFEI